MKHIYVFCEGLAERGFRVQVLQSHRFPDGDGKIHTLAVGEKCGRPVHGIGSRSYATVRRFISNTMKGREQRDVYFTTMFDLYRLPGSFPGKAQLVKNPNDPESYVLALEKAFADDIDHRSFIPYIQLHEFETIVFAEPKMFAKSFENCENQIRRLEEIVASFPSIEWINDGVNTAPSKRIIEIFPEYDGRKSTAGPDIAARIGIKTIREKCPHFHQWLEKLEAPSQSPNP